MKSKTIFSLVIMILFSLSDVSAASITDPVEKNEQLTRKEYKAAVNELKAKIKSLRKAKREADTRAEKKAIRKDIQDVKKRDFPTEGESY